MKQAKNHSAQTFYTCQRDWPNDCDCQCGNNGMVFAKGTMQQALTEPEAAIAAITGQTSHYTTAFFEAFPLRPNSFIRGEGKTIEEAEDYAWVKFQRTLVCPQHEFEARGYTNGGGFCKHCDLFCSDVIPSPFRCKHCDVPTWYSEDASGAYWCEDHEALIPPAQWTETHRLRRQWQQYEAAHPLPEGTNLDLN